MQKYRVTYWVLWVIGGALLVAFAGGVFNAMNGVIVQIGWCANSDNLCLLWRYGIFAFGLIVVSIIIDILFLIRNDWNMVEFKEWKPFTHESVLGGIKVCNGKDFDLINCTAEIVRYEHETYFKKGLPQPIDYYPDTFLPRSLFWLVDRKPVIEMDIKRGKEGYLAIFFPSTHIDSKSKMPGISYEIKLHNKEIHVNPVRVGYIYVRISAKLNDKTLNPIIMRIRIDVENETHFLREIKSTTLPRSTLIETKRIRPQ